MSSLVEYLEDQQALEKQAREQMPYDPNECTFAMGALRQELYACLTCYRQTAQLNAVCYACSIRCHTSHDLVELFTKRSRTCDCGTSRVSGPCLVRYPQWTKLDAEFQSENDSHRFTPDIPDSNNRYGHNFKGEFCDCNMPYNPLTVSNMHQCTFGVKCDEDWYHEECIMGLRPGVVNKSPKRAARSQAIHGRDRLDELSEPGLDASSDNKVKAEVDDEDEHDDNDEEYDILPLPGFPDLDSFDSTICWKCASEYPAEMEQLVNTLHCETVFHVPAKTIDERISKISPDVSTTDEKASKRTKKDFPKTIFLKEDYREKLKHHVDTEPSSKLSVLLKKYPFLYLDDPIYRPPDDDDDSSSVFELGIRELGNMPSDQAAQGLAAYEKIKSKLTEFLKPFAQEGKIVTEDEVKAFFKSETRK